VSRRRIIALILIGAVVGFLWWLPARLFAPLLPGELRCTTITGSLWHGGCEGLAVRGSRSGDLRWSLHWPRGWPLVAEADFLWTRDDARVSGVVTLATTDLATVRLAEVRVPLQTLRDAMPADVALGPLASVAGRLETQDLVLALDQRGQLTALNGSVILRETRLLRWDAAIGDYSGAFAGTTGTLRDLGGPLALQGDARIGAPGSYAVSLRVTPRVAGLIPALPPGGPIEITIDGRL